jgi:hypothetical protein
VSCCRRLEGPAADTDHGLQACRRGPHRNHGDRQEVGAAIPAVGRKIEDKKNIDGVKVGDRIDITYTQAPVIAAEPVRQ